MKILSIDTASNICGVSILENTNLLINLDSNTGTTHSEKLMPMILDAFEKTGLTLNNIDLIICDKGPGSFTGIRIGIATCKAFCDSTNIQGIGVSSLETLAHNVKNDGLICSLIDCKKNNCYFALYNLQNGVYSQIIEPSTNSLEEIIDNLKEHTSPITFVGDGAIAYKEFIISQFENSLFVNPEQNILNSYNLALAGLSKFNKNEFDEMLPMYLKKPQAEKQLEERLQSKCTS